ncbi:hypothetical protein, partial [Nonomuraea sp. SBT364]|uniref:hypothetical protein n=1 Tax=Nonomuraea sp. SBT364 TaxID=1580530 RepID=UPI0012E12982
MRSFPMARHVAARAGAPALIIALAACGMTGGPSGGGERQDGARVANHTEDSAPVSGQSTPPETTATTTSTTATTPAASPSAPAPIASQRFKLGGRDMTVAITQLQREGKMTTLNLTITNEDGPSWRISNDLGKGPTDYTVGGLSLVDAGN